MNSILGSTLMPLETTLKSLAEGVDLNAAQRLNLYERYIGFKAYMERDVYKLIGAATSSEDGGVYTDHGIDHFNAVIRYANELIFNPEKKEVILNGFELFVLLVAILLHDAGNIFGRCGHEKKTRRILAEAGSGLFSDNFEIQLISRIAEAHGGKAVDASGVETKDTIVGLNLKASDEYRGIPVRPQLIAAIVRFADEICEDRSRAASYLLRVASLPKQSEVYHAYAAAVRSVSVDLFSHEIRVSIDLKKEDLLKKYGKNEGEVFLVDEISSRLEKMYSEMRYCNRFMTKYIQLSRIRATVSIHDDDDLVAEQVFELKETGYPDASFSFSSEYPEWTGEVVCQLYRGEAPSFPQEGRLPEPQRQTMLKKIIDHFRGRHD